MSSLDFNRVRFVNDECVLARIPDAYPDPSQMAMLSEPVDEMDEKFDRLNLTGEERKWSFERWKTGRLKFSESENKSLREILREMRREFELAEMEERRKREEQWKAEQARAAEMWAKEENPRNLGMGDPFLAILGHRLSSERVVRCNACAGHGRYIVLPGINQQCGWCAGHGRVRIPFGAS